MKNIFGKPYAWAKQNFWNIFSGIGVVGTFYFSLFYVPGYVNELLIGKEEMLNESIISDVQEIIFNGEELNVYDIQSLIKGKELNIGVKYKYNADDLLVQVEDRFVSNRFIPLKKRKELIISINKIREGYKPTKEPKVQKSLFAIAMPLLASTIGILISLLGIISIFDRARKDKEIEADIEEEVNDSSNIAAVDKSHRYSISYFEYQNMVRDILLDIGMEILGEEPNQPGKPISRPDFVVKRNNTIYVVECKKYHKLVGLHTIREFLHMSMEHGKPGVLVTASGLTARAAEAISKHNDLYNDLKAHIVIGNDRESIQKEINTIIT